MKNLALALFSSLATWYLFVKLFLFIAQNSDIAMSDAEYQTMLEKQKEQERILAHERYHAQLGHEHEHGHGHGHAEEVAVSVEMKGVS